MKRTAAVILVLTLMFTLFSVSVSAAGSLLFSETFDNWETNTKWILEGNLYFQDADGSNPCVCAYSDGVTCQMEFRPGVPAPAQTFAAHTVSTRIQFREYDYDEGPYWAGLWWRDNFATSEANEAAGIETELSTRAAYMLKLDPENQTVFITRETNTPGVLETLATVNLADYDIEVEVGESSDNWVTLGAQLTPGHIKAYVNNTKVIDINVTGLCATEKSPIILWNSNMYVAFDDVLVGTADYPMFGDEGNTDTPITEASSQQNHDAPVDNEGNTIGTIDKDKNVRNDKGEIIGHVDDNGDIVDMEGKVIGRAVENSGSAQVTQSATTGDGAFIIAVILAVTLGAAFTVKRVYSK